MESKKVSLINSKKRGGPTALKVFPKKQENGWQRSLRRRETYIHTGFLHQLCLSRTADTPALQFGTAQLEHWLEKQTAEGINNQSGKKDKIHSDQVYTPE